MTRLGLERDKDSSPSVQNDRVFRLTMTGLEPLAARPIGASARNSGRPPADGLSSHARAKAPTGARPFGRPRGAAGRQPGWRERNRCSATKGPGVAQGQLERDKDSSPSVQNDRVFRLTMTGLEPLAARPIGASARNSGGPPADGLSSHARAKAPTGARPFGRPRGAAGRQPGWRERNRCSATKGPGVAQGRLESDKDSSPSVQNDSMGTGE